MNNPFVYTPHPLCLKAARGVIEDVLRRPSEWRGEALMGKTFGVMVCEGRKYGNEGLENGDGKVVLRAYSGQILGRSDWEGYVPAVFDYLQDDGYFKRKEAEIVDINKEIARIEASTELAEARMHAETLRRRGEMKVESEKLKVKLAAQDNSTFNSQLSTFSDSYIRMRQFQKAELRRIKARVKAEIAEAETAVSAITDRIVALKAERKRRSDALQQWLFDNFQMLNAHGERRNLTAIFGEWAARRRLKTAVPPSGSGECCAPKLLQYAYINGLKPIAIAEFTIENNAPQFVGACQSRCAPILDWMLRGQEVEANPLEQQDFTTALPIIYEDERIIVVDKPAGMLSVPGKSSRRSAYDILREMRPECPDLMLAHRLDMQTSGVLVAAKSAEVYRELQIAFSRNNHQSKIIHHQLEKTYYAILDGILPLSPGTEGEISLPLAADYYDRPRQKVDRERGKAAVTRYRILGEVDGHTAVELHPVTGRTHQLRLHCAHPDGLGLPILGDSLYGQPADRLYLHAERLELHVPAFGYDNIAFTSPRPWL